MCGCSFESLAQCRIEALPGCGHLLRCYAQCFRAGKAIELHRIAKHGAIAASAHVCNDAPDSGKHSIESRTASPFKRGQNLRCLRRASSFCPDQLHVALPRG
jgi:hypothetical protein